MAAVLPARLIPSEQSKADLVDEGRRLECDVRSFAGQVAQSHAMQLVVNEGDESLEGFIAAVAPYPKQPGDIAVRRTIVRLHPELAVRLAVYQSRCHVPRPETPAAAIPPRRWCPIEKA